MIVCFKLFYSKCIKKTTTEIKKSNSLLQIPHSLVPYTSVPSRHILLRVSDCNSQFLPQHSLCKRVVLAQKAIARNSVNVNNRSLDVFSPNKCLIVANVHASCVPFCCASCLDFCQKVLVVVV